MRECNGRGDASSEVRLGEMRSCPDLRDGRSPERGHRSTQTVGWRCSVRRSPECRDAEQVRIRHYGFLSNRGRKEKLEVVKRLIANSEHLATADEEANSPDLESAEPSTPSAQSAFAVFVVSLAAVYGCRLWADMP